MAEVILQVEGDPELVHRRIVEGHLDVHPSQNAIVVHYEVEATVLSEYGEPMVADRKECKRIININGLSGTTDIQALARQVVGQSDIIQPTRLPEVEQLLLYLRTRKMTKAGFDDKDVLEASSRKLRKQMEDLQMPQEQASLMELDHYLEFLYEDLPGKIRGTAMILQLARTPDNLLELASNDSLFLALARVLRDDWRKSIELTTNIIYVFFCLSTFSPFHTILTQHKIGSTCMTVVEHELKRHRSLQEDLSKKRKDSRSELGGTAGKKDYEKAKKKYQQLLKKQETLLRVALYLLLNIAEDTRVERKMRNRGLVAMLLTLLERDHQELLILAVSFLKKLSIFRENKDQMAEGGVVKKLVKVIPCDNEILVNVTLRLLLNLTFDPTLREEMVKVGLLPKLVALLADENHRVVVLCVLYHISMDKKSRAVFAYTECVPTVMKLVLECPDELVEPETVALGINLACETRSAQLMCKGPGLKLLMRRSLKTQDSLLMKMVRNISQHHGPTKRLFLSYLSDLGGVVGRCEDEEFLVEVLGILGNLTIPEVDFERVVSELDLLTFLISSLKDPTVKDDILLEVVVVCGTFSLDERCAALLVQAGLPDLLVTILKAKQEDDELVLQIVYVFHQLVLHETTRQQIIKDSQAPDYLLELMNDKNREICRLCSKILDMVAECDLELAQKIKQERFRWHNFQWLEMMTGETLYEEEEADEDYLDPHFLHMAAELYENPELYYEMQSQLESAHGGPGEASVHPYVQYGNPLASKGMFFSEPSFSEALEYGDPSPYGSSAASALQFTDTQKLSSQQYAMLLNSMQDPLAMYSSSFATGGSLEPSSSAEFDPTDLHGAPLSPVYGEAMDYSDHPAFTMMSMGHPPHPPNPSPHRPPTRTGF